MGKTEEHGRKKYLIIDDYMLDKIPDRFKAMIGKEKFY